MITNDLNKHNTLYLIIQRGYCPDLELLEVNTRLDSKDCELSVCIQALQMACPKLKVKSYGKFSGLYANVTIVTI